MNIALDDELAMLVQTSSEANERRWTEEVRYQLRKAYAMDRAPVEVDAGVSA
jgi:hypothetical protein